MITKFISNNSEVFAKIMMVVKIILFVTGLIFLFWIMRAIYNKFFKPDSEIKGTEENQQKVSEETIKADLDKTLKKNKLTYPLSLYDTLVNSYIGKIRLTGKLTKYEDVYYIFTKLHNYADLLQFKTTFGTRKIGNEWFAPMVTLDESVSLYCDLKTQALWKELNRAFAESKTLNKK